MVSTFDEVPRICDSAWNRDFAAERFVSGYEVVDTDSRLTVREHSISISFIVTVLLFTYVGAMAFVWGWQHMLPIAIGEKLAISAFGLISCAVLVFLFNMMAAEIEQNQRNLFYLCKDSGELVTPDGTRVACSDVVYFRLTKAMKNDFGLTLVSVGYCDEGVAVESAVVALTGRLKRNLLVGNLLASYCGVPIYECDARKDRDAMRLLFGQNQDGQE